MTTKIINHTNLTYQEIGLIIDELKKRIVDKKSYCLFKFRGNMYNVETEIMKSCFKVIIKESK